MKIIRGDYVRMFSDVIMLDVNPSLISNDEQINLIIFHVFPEKDIIYHCNTIMQYIQHCRFFLENMRYMFQKEEKSMHLKLVHILRSLLPDKLAI